MGVKSWEKKVLAKPDAATRVAEIEASCISRPGSARREQAGLSPRDLAKRLGVSQPRIAAIERSKHVTVELLEQYVEAVGSRLHVTVVKGNQRTTLISAAQRVTRDTKTKRSATRSRRRPQRVGHPSDAPANPHSRRALTGTDNPVRDPRSRVTVRRPIR